VRSALTAGRLRARVGLDDAIGAGLTLVAIVLVACIGVHNARLPKYGPIDEITHTAYVLAVAKDFIPPFVGRDLAYVGDHPPLAPRDVRIPAPDKVGSAPVPIGPRGEVTQAEAIQPPLYYYVAAPVTWFVPLDDAVIAIRLFDVFLLLCTLAIVFLAVRDIAGAPLGGGISALLLASAGGEIDIFSYVTNGAIMLPLGAAAIWLGIRGVRDARVTWPLTAVAAAFAITQIIVVPLAAVCLLAPAVRQLRAQGRATLNDLARKIGLGALPLALWVASNLWRYRWPVPHAITDSGSGGFTGASTSALHLDQFMAAYFSSLYTSLQEPFHWFEFSPYSWDYRPLALSVAITLVGVASALFRGTQQQRTAIGYYILAIAIAHFTVFCMLYLAIILTGGGDFVYRYFSAEAAAAACLVGASFSMLFRNPTVQRVATLLVAVALTYWTYNASPL
jgi:hypothetical protein